MKLQGRKFVASYSGGKDSVLALYRAIRSGMEPACLIITYNTQMGRSWFHGIPEELLQEVSASLHIPVRLIQTSGEDYAERFREELRRQKANGVEVCVFGDIDIEEHLQWCSNICREAEMEAFFPLWQEPRERLVREFIDDGFTANITVVDTARLSDRHLGMVLSEKAMASIAAEGADVCGENGEYHSFVSDGPLFSYPLPFEYGEKVLRNGYAILPVCRKRACGE